MFKIVYSMSDTWSRWSSSLSWGCSAWGWEVNGSDAYERQQLSRCGCSIISEIGCSALHRKPLGSNSNHLDVSLPPFCKFTDGKIKTTRAHWTLQPLLLSNSLCFQQCCVWFVKMTQNINVHFRPCTQWLDKTLQTQINSKLTIG